MAITRKWKFLSRVGTPEGLISGHFCAFQHISQLANFAVSTRRLLPKLFILSQL
jgi:hypothetical protein